MLFTHDPLRHGFLDGVPVSVCGTGESTVAVGTEGDSMAQVVVEAVWLVDAELAEDLVPESFHGVLLF